MGKRKQFGQPEFDYKDPFHSSHSSHKHAFQQVNGETERSRHTHIAKIDTRKRLPL